MSIFKIFFSKPNIIQNSTEIGSLMRYIEQNHLIMNSPKLHKNCSDFEKFSEDFPNDWRIKFLWYQLQLNNIQKNNVRFNSDLLVCAFQLYINGPKTYEFLRKLVFLPTTWTLRNLTKNFGLNQAYENELKSTLSKLCSELEPRQHIVTMKIDEMSVTPSLDFRGEQIYWGAKQLWKGNVFVVMVNKKNSWWEKIRGWKCKTNLKYFYKIYKM